MKFCPKCGMKLYGEFCGECGCDIRKLMEENETQNSMPKSGEATTPVTTAPKPPKEKKPMPKWIVVTLAWCRMTWDKAWGFVRTYPKQTIMTAAGSIAVLVTAIILIVTLSNDFRQGAVEDVDLGFTKEQVLDEFGEPDSKSDSEWVYYSSAYTDIQEKIDELKAEQDKNTDDFFGSDFEDAEDFEGAFDDAMGEDMSLSSEIDVLKEELKTVKHDKIVVRFDSEGLVCEVTLQKDISRSDKNPVVRVVEDAKFLPEALTLYSDPARGKYGAKVYYDNGDYRMDYIAFDNASEIDTSSVKDDQIVKWKNPWGECTAEIDITEQIHEGTVICKSVSNNTNIIYELKSRGNGSFDWKELPEFDLTVLGTGVLNGDSFRYELARYEENILSVTLEGEITEIEGDPFKNFSCLNSITLNATLEKISDDAIKDILLYNKEPEMGEFYIGSLLYRYVGVTPEDYTVPNGTIAIYANAFSNQKNLKKLTVPTSVKCIGKDAFSGCSSLESVTIPFVGASDGAEKSDEINMSYAFDQSFARLTDVTIIGDGDTTVSMSSFSTMYQLAFLELGDGVIGITGSGGYNIVKLTLGKNIQTIDANFYENKKLVEICNHSSVELSLDSEEYGSITYYAKNIITNPNDSHISISTDGYVFYNNSTEMYLMAYVGESSEIVLPEKYLNQSYKIYTRAFAAGYFMYEVWDYHGSFTDQSRVRGGGIISSVVIPDTITCIPTDAFECCTSLETIDFGQGVTNIGESAFIGCLSLKTIKIGSSLSNIEPRAFGTCTALSEVHLDDVGMWLSVVLQISNDIIHYDEASSSNPFYYGASLYIGKTKITELKIPDGVVEINGNFRYCEGITSVTIPATVREISSRAFWGSDLVRIEVSPNNETFFSVGNCIVTRAEEKIIMGCKGSIIPDDGSVTSIDSYAFYGCRGLTSVTIPDSVTSIGSYAFSDCSSLTSVTIGNGVTSIGSYAFSDCSSMTSVTIGNGVTSIGYEAFSDCSSLTSVTIPDSVTSIGSYAFSGCRGLTSVTIGNGVTSIDSDVFSGCTDIMETVDGVKYVDKWVVGCDASVISVVLRTDTIGIGPSAFYGCRGLTSVTIPDSVTSIGNKAFSGCRGLTSVTIGNGVTSIGHEAFSDCSSLTSVIIGNGVTSIGEDAFYGCTGIIETDNGVMYVGKWAIGYDTSVTSVVLRTDTIGIGYGVFRECSRLTSVTIPDSVTRLSSYAFSGCDRLTSVTIGNGVTSIGDNAFWRCSSLTSVNIPNSVTSIGDRAFCACRRLTSIIIPNSVTSIGDAAFSGCSDLTSITFADTSTWYRTTDFDDWKNKTGGMQTDVSNSMTNVPYFEKHFYWYKE